MNSSFLMLNNNSLRHIEMLYQHVSVNKPQAIEHILLLIIFDYRLTYLDADINKCDEKGSTVFDYYRRFYTHDTATFSTPCDAYVNIKMVDILCT